ncbi:S-layer homology domain-containing protein, partial [uncultured Lactobacillus sp.]|uniref:S-layer homology domain-containing protein n=1 Tax=uncultured Lactobacillus sp. TaxID=153152 RepID=UPI00262015D2
MRNLKKILALVLALVMSLSLMATAGAADAGANGEQITPAYQTALDVLGKEGLKVFEGYSDGTFKPQQPITRAEVATILYRIATGDVNGTQSGIYTDMASTKFTDLEGANWARGYINYCANAELIVGVGNNKFQPSQNITGYATLAMVLRALGYDKAGEFRGSGWEIRTASLAKSLGITNNITDAQLGGAATREVVAEILFRAILNETVTYSALTSGGYTKTGETLAKKNLGLDDIVGVVTANEWADLYDDEPLAKDKTRLDVDGKNFNLDITSDAALLGTSVHAYVKDGRALTGLEDSGRNTIQNSEGAAAEVAKLKGGLKLTEGTEYMINFSEAGEVDYSDWRIEYVIELESDADRTLVEGNGGEWEADGKTYNKVIKVGQKITKVDMTLIQRIFYGSDNKAVDSADGVYDGEVYVGTKSTLGKDDISDEISYREFVSKYLNADSVKFDDSDNGESLRVIDNNNDGVAEYVLRVDFVMTTITDYNSRTETWTVEYDNTEIKNSEIATEEELAVGDVILYTYIDGVYHISFPETATESIAKRGIDYKKNTINCGDNTYTWSGIDRLAARYYQEITEVEVETSYTLFLDRYGYVRLATEANKGLALLTDAYYGTDWRNGDYRVETWAMGAEEATDVTVTADKGLSAWTRYADRTLDTDKAYDGFIDTYEERDHGNAGTWDRLHEFGQYRYGTLDQIGTQDDINGHYTGWSNGGNGTDPFRTNVAAYVEKDGEWTLYDVTANNSSRTNYHSYEIYDTGVDGSVSAKDRTMYGITAWNNDAKTVNTDENVRIQANTSTQYYWVQFNSRGEISKVESWTGYTNAPSDFIPERGYAITSEVAGMNDRYQVAEVVVFEDAYEEDFLRAWFVNAYRDNRSLLTAGWDGETYTSDVTIDSNVLNTGKLFEFVDADGDVISANYGKYHVYAGVVMTEGRILNGDYVALSRSTTTAIPREGEHFNSGIYADKVWKEFIFGEIPVYRLNDRVVGKLNSDGRDLEECTPRMDDLVLYMTNEKGEVALVIDVTQSEETAVYNSMLALWNEVVLDYYPTLSVSVTNKDGVGPDEYNYPANHTYPINNGTVKIPASVFEAEGWTVAEKGILVVCYGENSTYDRAGLLKEGGVNYFVIEGIKGVIGVEIEWVKVEAPEELDKDGAKAEIDGYRADEV